jgi:hypothetical protein
VWRAESFESGNVSGNLVFLAAGHILQLPTQDAGMTAISSTIEPAICTAAAERMRRHRQRRRDGLRCLIIELRETEIDDLIRKGLLKSEMRNDPSAIIDALYAHLDNTLDPPS